MSQQYYLTVYLCIYVIVYSLQLKYHNRWIPYRHSTVKKQKCFTEGSLVAHEEIWRVEKFSGRWQSFS